MSSESFSAVSFPELRHVNQDAMDTQARTHGHATGYAAGLRAAEVEAARRLAELDATSAEERREGYVRIDIAIEALEAAALALHSRTVPTIERAQDVLAASAIELAEAILGYELEHGKNSARSALARVLDNADQKMVLAIRMNPADILQLDNASRTATMVEIVPDATIARGDAVADFSDGYLDARIQTALARARSALLGETP